MTLLDAFGGGLDVHTCSRAGCREHATWQISWRNPKIHDETRSKVWLACDEHVEYLHTFLASRDFPVEVSPIDDHVSGTEGQAAS